MNSTPLADGRNGVSSAPVLAPEHIEYLTKRAVPLDYALAAGLHSMAATEVANALGLAHAISGGLAVPYPSVEPPYVRVRADSPPAIRRSPSTSHPAWT